MPELDAWMGPGLQIAHVPLRATVLLLLAFVVAVLLRRRAASLRHRLWAITLVGLLLLPVPALLLLAGVSPVPGIQFELLPAIEARPAPAAEVPTTAALLEEQGRSTRHLAASWRRLQDQRQVPRTHGLIPPAPAAASPARVRSSSLVERGVLVIWLVGAAVVVGRAARSRRRAQALLRLSQPADPEVWPGTQGRPVRESDAVDLPITVGALRPVVLLPRQGRDWPLAWRRSAVAHELAHLERRDPLLQWLAELATAVHWYHPLAWLAARRLRIERELAADDDVLLQGNRSSDYAQLLVTLACAPDAPVGAGAGAVLPLLTPAGLKARLLGILNPAHARRTHRTWVFLLGVASTLALVPVAAALPVRAVVGPKAAAGSYVIGRVVDTAGRAQAGVDVDFLLATGVVRTSTDRDGTIRSPVPGDQAPQEMFNLYARQGGLAARTTVLAVPFGTKLPIDLRLAPARRVRGTVTSAEGRPVAGARLHVIDWQSHAVGPGGGALGETTADGSFVVEGLMYGDYSLLAVAPNGVGAVERVRIEDQDPASVALRLPDTGQITARLQDEDGRPLAGVRVERTPSQSQYPRGQTGERHVDWDVSAADGSVRLLPLGETLMASGRDAQGQVIEALFVDGGVPRWLIGGPGIKRPRPPGQLGQVVVLRRPAVLSIRAETEDGQPVPGIRLQIMPDMADHPWTYWGRQLTDPDGRTPPIAVPPGKMAVAVTNGGLRRAISPQVVEVAPGEGKHVRLVVPAAALTNATPAHMRYHIVAPGP